MPRSSAQSHQRPAKAGLRVAIVVSRYNHSVTNKLLEGAQQVCARAHAAVDVFPAPGSYELPALARACAASGHYQGVVALGCLVRGETRHDRYIAEAVAQGLVAVSVATGVPVAFGVLTVDHAKQAKERAGGRKGNKGAEAAAAVLESIVAIDAIMSGKSIPLESIAGRKPDKAKRPKRSERSVA
jgi:6,7-dimethyl-8-ribityllumazine synthase